MRGNRRRLIGALALLFLLNIAVISLAQQAQAVTYRQGASGEQVRIIQSKLKNWGYYDGTVDGQIDQPVAQSKVRATFPDSEHCWDGPLDATLSVYIGDGIQYLD